MRALPDWSVRLADLPPDIWGLTDHSGHVVWLDRHLTQAQRRCTLEHERQHILRGDVGHQDERVEQQVERAVAELLAPLSALADAARWAHDEHQLAEELWIDLPTLRARLAGLSDAERRGLG